jgi:hypothetical protein
MTNSPKLFAPRSGLWVRQPASAELGIPERLSSLQAAVRPARSRAGGRAVPAPTKACAQVITCKSRSGLFKLPWSLTTAD